MFNADTSLPNASTITTEQIQKYLEENKELILAILEYQNLGKINEIAQCQAKLQHNLTFLAKLADVATQAQTPSQVSSQPTMQQGQSMQQHHVAISQPQPDVSTLNPPFEMNDQQQHLAMSLHQPDISASKLPLQMNEQHYKLPHFLYQQQQLIPGPMGSFPGTTSGLYQASQTRLGNLSDTPSSNQTGSDSGHGWS
ncbi:GRF1-interacting factor 3 [Cajanus cajan]|uniref:SS18-like protein 2 n=1 Tax=Cajanus cajan TaxID=3821 RepID=A0A151RS37_CAJCA|nr:GRF1-interacting factor 3 [Cajanus cajan]KYP45362.1 SS18-like protein 2 [Cajanus cajan]